MNETNGALWSFLRDNKYHGATFPLYTLTGTSPHADIRYFDWNHLLNQLICTCDGGIWIHTNPHGIGDWIHKNGDLVITEFTTVTYDSRTNTIAGGAQDNDGEYTIYCNPSTTKWVIFDPISDQFNNTMNIFIIFFFLQTECLMRMCV